MHWLACEPLARGGMPREKLHQSPRDIRATLVLSSGGNGFELRSCLIAFDSAARGGSAAFRICGELI